jgi:hypothetical protein
MTGRMLRRLLAVASVVPLLLLLSPSAAFACGVTYEGGDPNTGCSGAVPVGGAVLVGAAAVVAAVALSALSFLRGTMSATDFRTLLSAMAASAPSLPAQPALPAGRATMRLDQVRRANPGVRWVQGETLAAQMYGGRQQVHFPVAPNADPDFPVTAPGGRYVDSAAPQLDGTLLAVEVKTYGQWRTVQLASGQKVPQKVEVPLTDTIREQIAKDVAIRRADPTYDPRWAFLGAPPSAALAQLLGAARIIFLVYG